MIPAPDLDTLPPNRSRSSRSGSHIFEIGAENGSCCYDLRLAGGPVPPAERSA
jgi:hypothetical protein